MKARTGAVAALAFGGAAAGAYWLGTKIRHRLSFYDLLDAFAYKLGQVSGASYGRMEVAAKGAVRASDALELIQSDMHFSIELDINDKHARWVKARFRTVKRPGAIGQIYATMYGDHDTILRLVRWLRERPFSVFTEVQLNGRGTSASFCMSDERYEDVSGIIRTLRSRAHHTDPELDGAPADPVV